MRWISRLSLCSPLSYSYLECVDVEPFVPNEVEVHTQLMADFRIPRFIIKEDHVIVGNLCVGFDRLEVRQFGARIDFKVVE